MLKRVSIKGFLFIEEANIEFDKGFNVITGETGAGKSILLGALNVCLGGKIPKDIINPRSDHFSVSLTFDLSGQPALNKKVQAQLPPSPPSNDAANQTQKRNPELLTILTLLTQKGELHYFVNNIPVTVNRLTQLAEFLVDIHSQRQNQYLLKSSNHIYFFDSYLSAKKERSRYIQAYQAFTDLQKKLETLQEQKESLLQQKDFLKFTEAELSKHLTTETDYTKLKQELSVLERQEKFSEHLFAFEEAARHTLKYLTEANLSLKKAHKEIKPETAQYTQYTQLKETLEEHSTTLEDSLTTVIRTIDRSDLGQRLDTLQKQLAGIENLEKKYGASASKLKQKYEEITEKLEFLETCEAKHAELLTQLTHSQEIVLTEALRLHEKRRVGIGPFEDQFKAELAALGMENGRLLVSFKPETPEKQSQSYLTKRLHPSGYDRLEFLYASAKEMDAKPLRDIASGGELSRMMLALKALLSERIMIGTMIFDEIDTGVGGLTAGRLAEKIRNLSHDRQIIVITHLPQIARVANQHFKIEKVITSDGTTETQIQKLQKSATVTEICRMLGRKPTPENLNFAQKFIKEDT